MARRISHDVKQRYETTHKQPISTEKRPPEVNEIVLLNESPCPRGTWPLGVIEPLHPEPSKVRTTTIRLSNGKKVQRTVNSLFPLEIRAKADAITATAATVISTTVIRETLNKAVTRRKHTLPFYLLPCFLISGLLTLVVGSAAASGTQGIHLPIPETQNCTVERFSHLTTTRVSVFERKLKRVEAISCFQITHKNCTRAFLRFSMYETLEEPIISAVTAQACEEIRNTKRFSGLQLERIGAKRWKSSQPSTASYAIFGERCTATVNYELDEGYVLIGDDVHIDSCLANVTACKASTGKCMADGRIVLWDKKMLVEQCAWHRVGTYLAQVTEKRIIVDKLQASFVPLEAFDESWTQAEQCQLQSFAPMQNGILITFDDWKQQDVTDWYRKARVHAPNISSVELGTRFDRENAKFQYASDRWLQQFKLHLNKYAETQCQTRNNFLILIRSISRSDPSMAAKLLLHRGDVSAIREGDKLIVFPHNGIIEKSNEGTHGGEIENELVFWSATLQDTSIQQAQAQIDLLKSRSARWGLRAKPSTFSDSRTALSDFGNEIETLAEEANNNIQHIFEAFKYWEALLIVIAIIAVSIIITFATIKCMAVVKKLRKKGEISNPTVIFIKENAAETTVIESLQQHIDRMRFESVIIGRKDRRLGSVTSNGETVKTKFQRNDQEDFAGDFVRKET
uniref:Putative env-like protein n=1 Tax=Ascaris lumbricoides TaxID=6252 RepID=Q17052_ASCLU|nr:putative env-like protein [Ascaris lumbricoides]